MSPFNHFNNWQKYLRQLTEPAAEVQQGEERQWARLLAGLSVALLTMGIFVVIIWILISPNFTTAPYISGFAIAAIFSIYLLSRTRYYQFGAVCLIVLLLLIVGAIIFTAPGSLVDRMRVLYFLTIAVLLASLFFSIRGLLLVIGISLVGTAVFFFVPEAPFSVTYSYIVFMVVMSALLILATVMRNDYVKRLHESQRRYHALFNQSNDAVCIFGLDGRIIEANQHAVALLGYAPEELVGMTFRGVVVDNELIESEKLFQRLRANEPIPIYEQWVKKKDGSLILVENNVELVQDANGNPLHIQSIARDITLRKQAEAALRASEERFRRLTFQSPDTIYILNFTNFQIEFINKDSFLGYTLAELKQSGSIFNNVHPTDQAQVAHYWETVMQNQEISPQSVDYRLQHKDGHWEWIHNRSIVLAHTAEGKPSEVLIVLTLITDTKQVEEKLRQQEEYARILIEQTPIGIVTVNMDGEVTAANPRSLEILGSPGLSATLGLNVLTLPPIVAAGISPMLAQSLATGKSNEMETWYTSIWDKATYLFIRAVPYFDGLGHQIGLIILVEDLTQRERAEEGMRQAQKLESLGVLAGGIAHDFNNLLVAMLGQASLALAKLAPKSPGRPHVEKAVTAAEQAARLTQQLLAYSGRGQFHVDLLDLNGLIEENLHLFTAMIPKQIILKTTLAELLPLVEVDIAQIQQVVMNLIINAVDALGSESGTIQIVTRTQMVTEADHQFWYYTSVPLAEGVYVTLEVSDDGKGDEPGDGRKYF